MRGRDRKRSNDKVPERGRRKRCNDLVVYTDGSGSPDGYGASAFVVLNCNQTEILYMGCEFLEFGTSNQAELRAVTAAIEWCRNSRKSNVKLIIHSDSKYVVNGFNEWSLGWAKKRWKVPIKNKYMWKRISDMRKNVELRWVKGHAGNPWNMLADYLAGNCKKTGYENTQSGS